MADTGAILQTRPYAISGTNPTGRTTSAVLHTRPYAVTANTAGRTTGGVLQTRPYAVTVTNPVGRTSGAVLHARPYAVTGTNPIGRTTGVVCYIVPRVVAGVYRPGVDGTLSFDVMQWLPSAMTSVVVSNGRGGYVLSPPWYQFFATVAQRLGGIGGSSIPDVVSAVESTQTSAVLATAHVAAVVQQSQTNAEALSVVREVLQNNAVPGAAQIPPVSRSPYENIP